MSLTQTWHMKVLAGARSALQKMLFFRSGWPGGTEHTEPGGLWGEAPSAARGMSQVVSGIALSPSAVTSRLSCTAPRAAQLGSESAALHGGPGHRGPPGAFPRSARGFLPALFIPEMRVTHAFTSKAHTLFSRSLALILFTYRGSFHCLLRAMSSSGNLLVTYCSTSWSHQLIGLFHLQFI